MIQKKYEIIRDQLLDAISSGSLQPGTRLKDEVTLAKEYGVSVLTVRRAMADLVSAGYILRKQKSGTFVTAPPISSFKTYCRQQGIAVLQKPIDQFSAVTAQIEDAGDAFGRDHPLKGVLILFEPFVSHD